MNNHNKCSFSGNTPSVFSHNTGTTQTQHQAVSWCYFQLHLTEVNQAAKHGSSERQRELPEIVSLQAVNIQVESGFKTGKPALAQDYTGDFFTLNQQ